MESEKGPINHLLPYLQNEHQMGQYIEAQKAARKKLHVGIWSVHFLAPKFKRMKIIDKYFDEVYKSTKTRFPDDIALFQTYVELGIPTLGGKLDKSLFSPYKHLIRMYNPHMKPRFETSKYSKLDVSYCSQDQDDDDVYSFKNADTSTGCNLEFKFKSASCKNELNCNSSKDCYTLGDCHNSRIFETKCSSAEQSGKRDREIKSKGFIGTIKSSCSAIESKRFTNDSDSNHFRDSDINLKPDCVQKTRTEGKLTNLMKSPPEMKQSNLKKGKRVLFSETVWEATYSDDDLENFNRKKVKIRSEDSYLKRNKKTFRSKVDSSKFDSGNLYSSGKNSQCHKKLDLKLNEKKAPSLTNKFFTRKSRFNNSHNANKDADVIHKFNTKSSGICIPWKGYSVNIIGSNKSWSPCISKWNWSKFEKYDFSSRNSGNISSSIANGNKSETRSSEINICQQFSLSAADKNSNSANTCNIEYINNHKSGLISSIPSDQSKNTPSSVPAKLEHISVGNKIVNSSEEIPTVKKPKLSIDFSGRNSMKNPFESSISYPHKTVIPSTTSNMYKFSKTLHSELSELDNSTLNKISHDNILNKTSYKNTQTSDECCVVENQNTSLSTDKSFCLTRAYKKIKLSTGNGKILNETTHSKVECKKSIIQFQEISGVNNILNQEKYKIMNFSSVLSPLFHSVHSESIMKQSDSGLNNCFESKLVLEHDEPRVKGVMGIDVNITDNKQSFSEGSKNMLGILNTDLESCGYNKLLNYRYNMAKKVSLVTHGSIRIDLENSVLNNFHCPLPKINPNIQNRNPYFFKDPKYCTTVSMDALWTDKQINIKNQPVFGDKMCIILFDKKGIRDSVIPDKDKFGYKDERNDILYINQGMDVLKCNSDVGSVSVYLDNESVCAQNNLASARTDVSNCSIYNLIRPLLKQNIQTLTDTIVLQNNDQMLTDNILTNQDQCVNSKLYTVEETEIKIAKDIKNISNISTVDADIVLNYMFESCTNEVEFSGEKETTNDVIEKCIKQRFNKDSQAMFFKNKVKTSMCFNNFIQKINEFFVLSNVLFDLQSKSRNIKRNPNYPDMWNTDIFSENLTSFDGNSKRPGGIFLDRKNAVCNINRKNEVSFSDGCRINADICLNVAQSDSMSLDSGNIMIIVGETHNKVEYCTKLAIKEPYKITKITESNYYRYIRRCLLGTEELTEYIRNIDTRSERIQKILNQITKFKVLLKQCQFNSICTSENRLFKITEDPLNVDIHKKIITECSGIIHKMLNVYKHYAVPYIESMNPINTESLSVHKIYKWVEINTGRRGKVYDIKGPNQSYQIYWLQILRKKVRSGYIFDDISSRVHTITDDMFCPISNRVQTVTDKLFGPIITRVPKITDKMIDSISNRVPTISDKTFNPISTRVPTITDKMFGPISTRVQTVTDKTFDPISTRVPTITDNTFDPISTRMQTVTDEMFGPISVPEQTITDEIFGLISPRVQTIANKLFSSCINKMYSEERFLRKLKNNISITYDVGYRLIPKIITEIEPIYVNTLSQSKYHTHERVINEEVATRISCRDANHTSSNLFNQEIVIYKFRFPSLENRNIINIEYNHLHDFRMYGINEFCCDHSVRKELNKQKIVRYERICDRILTNMSESLIDKLNKKYRVPTVIWYNYIPNITTLLFIDTGDVYLKPVICTDYLLSEYYNLVESFEKTLRTSREVCDTSSTGIILASNSTLETNKICAKMDDIDERNLSNVAEIKIQNEVKYSCEMYATAIKTVIYETNELDKNTHNFRNDCDGADEEMLECPGSYINETVGFTEKQDANKMDDSCLFANIVRHRILDNELNDLITSFSKIKIYVADDDATTTKILTDHLNAHGTNCVTDTSCVEKTELKPGSPFSCVNESSSFEENEPNSRQEYKKGDKKNFKTLLRSLFIEIDDIEHPSSDNLNQDKCITEDIKINNLIKEGDKGETVISGHCSSIENVSFTEPLKRENCNTYDYCVNELYNKCSLDINLYLSSPLSQMSTLMNNSWCPEDCSPVVEDDLSPESQQNICSSEKYIKLNDDLTETENSKLTIQPKECDLTKLYKSVLNIENESSFVNCENNADISGLNNNQCSDVAVGISLNEPDSFTNQLSGNYSWFPDEDSPGEDSSSPLSQVNSTNHNEDSILLKFDNTFSEFHSQKLNNFEILDNTIKESTKVLDEDSFIGKYSQPLADNTNQNQDSFLLKFDNTFSEFHSQKFSDSEILDNTTKDSTKVLDEDDFIRKYSQPLSNNTYQNRDSFLLKLDNTFSGSHSQKLNNSEISDNTVKDSTKVLDEDSSIGKYSQPLSTFLWVPDDSFMSDDEDMAEAETIDKTEGTVKYEIDKPIKDSNSSDIQFQNMYSTFGEINSQKYSNSQISNTSVKINRHTDVNSLKEFSRHDTSDQMDAKNVASFSSCQVDSSSIIQDNGSQCLSYGCADHMFIDKNCHKCINRGYMLDGSIYQKSLSSEKTKNYINNNNNEYKLSNHNTCVCDIVETHHAEEGQNVLKFKINQTFDRVETNEPKIISDTGSYNPCKHLQPKSTIDIILNQMDTIIQNESDHNSTRNPYKEEQQKNYANNNNWNSSVLANSTSNENDLSTENKTDCVKKLKDTYQGWFQGLKTEHISGDRDTNTKHNSDFLFNPFINKEFDKLKTEKDNILFQDNKYSDISNTSNEFNQIDSLKELENERKLEKKCKLKSEEFILNNKTSPVTSASTTFTCNSDFQMPSVATLVERLRK